MIAILDYQAGNQTSVLRALQYLNIEAQITANADKLLQADGVIFPGVGAAGQAMSYLKEHKLDKILKKIVAENKALLGLCLGCQILLEKSSENNTACLNIIRGQCLAFDPKCLDEQAENIRIPHMGWNSINIKQNSALFNDIPNNAQFYFVHSYYVEVAKELCLATTNYGQEFCSVYGQDKIWAVQFHPEKSGNVGLQLLKNFATQASSKS